MNSNNNVTVTYNNESVTVAAEKYTEACDALIAKHGAGHGVPRVEKAAKPVSTWTDTVVDAEAKARIEAQHAKLNASGVRVDASEQFYATGTRMAREGYAVQEGRKREHDRKMPLADAVEALRATIIDEHREDVEVSAREFADALDGSKGPIKFGGKRLTEQAIRGICTRLKSPMGHYVFALKDRIGEALVAGDREAAAADKAKILDTLRHECLRNADARLVLRTRNSVNNDIFAVVSPGYTPADAPLVLEALAAQLATTPDAKGSYAYNPTTTDWEIRANVWTPTPVEEQAVGEAFEAYASIAARDNGTRGITGGGGVSLIRCLNATTYASHGARARRRHVGDVAAHLGDLFATATASIEALCSAWGTAREQEVAVPSGLTLEDAIPGFWRHLLTDRRSELQGVLAGRSESNVKLLTDAFHGERRDPNRLVRADFAQAWTRMIQDQPTHRRRDAEVAIGDWVVGGITPRHVEARA